MYDAVIHINELPASLKKIPLTMKSVLLLYFFSLTTFAQLYEKKVGESAEDFAQRCSENINWELKTTVETESWNNAKEPIFAFYLDKETNFLLGYVFIKISGNSYNRILIDNVGPEGDEATINELFLWNLDNDSEDELVILYSWSQNNHAPPISGYLYQVQLYQNFSVDNLKELNKIDSEKYFPNEFNGTNDSGEVIIAKYTNSKKIIKRLKQIKGKKASW